MKKDIFIFFGSEKRNKRIKGLVDCENEIAFNKEYEALKLSLSPNFITWLETMKGRLRSLVDSMKKCMLKPTVAGLGKSPNKWINNVTESLHNVMKEELDNKVLDSANSLERVKERIFDQQLNEIVRAIRGMGEYRLESKRDLQIHPNQWMEMKGSC